MSTELVKASTASAPAISNAASLPVMVERTGGADRFAWEESFYVERHNPHAQRADLRAIR